MPPLPPRADLRGDALVCHNPLCRDSNGRIVLCYRRRTGRLTSPAGRLHTIERRDTYHLLVPRSYSVVHGTTPARYQERPYVDEAREGGHRYDRHAEQITDTLPPEKLPVIILCRRCKEPSSVTPDLLA